MSPVSRRTLPTPRFYVLSPHYWGLGGFFLLFALAAPTLAATTYYVSPSGKDTNPGTSSKPFLTIQHGIDAAANGDTVTLKDGTYTGPGDVDLDFGGTNLTVNSVSGASKAIIDCNGTYYDAAHRGFYFHNGETAASVNGITIKNGNGFSKGGGIYNSANLTLTGCVFTNNIAYSFGSAPRGSGVYNAGTISLTHCTFTANGATNTADTCLYNNG